MKLLHNLGITYNDYSKQEVYAGNGYYYLNTAITSAADFDNIVMTDIINQMSMRYTCNRPPGAAGAALIMDTGGIVYGDVKPADGAPTCKDVGCMIEDGHCVRTIHAEVRAILNAAKFGLCTKNAVMYSILRPCYQCTKVIIAAGITKIVYAGTAYDEERTQDIIKSAPQHIEIVKLDVQLPYGD